MRLFARIFRLVWGTEVDRALRPVLAVSFVGSTAFSASVGFALGPFIGFQLADAHGDNAAWLFFASVSVFAAASGAAAVRASLGRRGHEPVTV